jgi:hypothetical protein
VGELDLPEKISKYSKTMGIIKNVLKPSLVQKHTRIYIYCEMKFMCRTAGCTKWDLKRNEEVLKEVKVEPILDYICIYQNNWREHVNRMSRTRIPKAIMYYQPTGKRSLGCPVKRWHENPLLRS